MSYPIRPYQYGQEGALSPSQYQMAQQHTPKLLATANSATSLAEQVLYDRQIQEQLRHQHHYVDRSQSGQAAWNYNCQVIHNPKPEYFAQPPEPRPGSRR